MKKPKTWEEIKLRRIETEIRRLERLFALYEERGLVLAEIQRKPKARSAKAGS